MQKLGSKHLFMTLAPLLFNYSQEWKSGEIRASQEDIQLHNRPHFHRKMDLGSATIRTTIFIDGEEKIVDIYLDSGQSISFPDTSDVKPRFLFSRLQTFSSQYQLRELPENLAYHNINRDKNSYLKILEIYNKTRNVFVSEGNSLGETETLMQIYSLLLDKNLKSLSDGDKLKIYRNIILILPAIEYTPEQTVDLVKLGDSFLKALITDKTLNYSEICSACYLDKYLAVICSMSGQSSPGNNLVLNDTSKANFCVGVYIDLLQILRAAESLDQKKLFQAYIKGEMNVIQSYLFYHTVNEIHEHASRDLLYVQGVIQEYFEVIGPSATVVITTTSGKILYTFNEDNIDQLLDHI